MTHSEAVKLKAPQTPWDPSGTAPPLEGDPRARTCPVHSVLLYPGELCRECLSGDHAEREE